MSHEIDIATGLPTLSENKIWRVIPYDIYEDPANDVFPVMPWRSGKNWVLIHIDDKRHGYYTAWIRRGDPVIASKANPASIQKAAIKLVARTERKEARKRKRDATYEASGRKLRDQRRAAKHSAKRKAHEDQIQAKHEAILGNYPPKKLEV